MQSIVFFLLAGLCEIGGGYLVWLALREGKNGWLALLGVMLLGLYGVVATMQPTHFGRAYAAYGGVFVALSLYWGWRVDGIRPDHFDLLGAGIVLLGVFVMMYVPRG
ncbi:MAG: YnfA family protein [Cyanobacteria bacterium P01_H01_bin.15]